MVPSPWRIQDTYGKTKKIRFLVRHSRHFIKIQFWAMGSKNYWSLTTIQNMYSNKVLIINFMFELYLNPLVELIILNVQCITYGDLVFVKS